MPTTPSPQTLLGENAYATVVAEIRDFAIFLVDLGGTVLSWNAGARALFGYEAGEIIGAPAAQLFTPKDRQNGVPAREMETARREGRAEDVRWHQKKDGGRFWANGVTTALYDEAGSPVGFAKIARDDTARRETEQKLRETGEQLQIALDVARIGSWVWHIAEDRVVADANLARFFGISPALALGSPIENYFRAIHPADAPRVQESAGRAAREGSHFTENYRIVQSDGSLLWVEARGKIRLDPNGDPLQLNGVVFDITERKRAEAALLESEERYGTLFQAIDNGFCVIDLLFDDAGHVADYRFSEVNPAFARQSGIKDAVGKTMRELVPDMDKIWFETYETVFYSGQPIHFESASHAMNRFFDVHAFRIGAPESPQVALIFTDISERKKDEIERERLLSEIQFERTRLSEIFQQAPAFVCIIRGRDFTFELANPAYYGLVGHRDIIGKPLLEALPEIEGQGFVELLQGVVDSGQPFEGREIPVKLQREAGGPLEDRYVNLLYQPLRESDGTISGVFSHGVDITEQVHARQEAEGARQEAETANRVKDEFLATLSHELRTPLTAILGWANILQAGGLSESEIQRAVATIERNARAQSQLIEDILDVSRVITGKLRLEIQPVELSTLIDEAVATLTPAAQAKEIRLQRVLDAGASLVSGDPARLGQVVWNLLSNAIKFTPKNGRVQVRLERINSHVEISVEDSGQGIAPEVLPHVFERFRQADSSSTRAYGGLGLGLAIVRHLVELHGGSVEARSDGLDRGAEFVVKLPLVAVRAPDKRSNPERRMPPTTGEPAASGALPQLDGLHVLVVDDQEDTRALLQAVLEGCGARVTLASRAVEALEALQTLRPDVLLSDIGMPEEDGFSLIKRVRALRKEQGGETPAAALTAFARVEDRVRVLRAGFQIHLPKPVEPMELATVVANLAGRREE